MNTDLCEMCEQAPATQTVTIQTMPGSLDTKFADLLMCDRCAAEYQEFLTATWRDKEAQS